MQQSVLVTVLFLVMITGCRTPGLSPKARIPESEVTKIYNYYYDNKYIYKNDKGNIITGTKLDDLKMRFDHQPTNRSAIRKEMSYELMIVVDYYYTLSQQELFSNRASLNFGWGTADLIMAQAASLFTPAATKSILAGAVAVSGGARALYNKEFFSEQTIFSILTTMNANRLQVKTRIQQKLENDSTSLEELLSLIQEYAAKSTPIEALMSISAKASVDQKTAVDENNAAFAKSIR